MNINELSAMTGENGERAVYGGAADASNNLAAIVQAKINSLGNDYMRKNEFNQQSLNESKEKFAKMIEHLPDSESRLAAFQSVRTMILASATKTTLATGFTDSLKKNGFNVTNSQFLAGKPMEIGDSTVYNDSILFSKPDGIKLINNVRSSLGAIFIDKSGNLNPASQKYINGLVKPAEQALDKYSATSSVNTALLGLVHPTLEKLTGKYQEFAIAQGLANENLMGMGPKLSNAPIMSKG